MQSSATALSSNLTIKSQPLDKLTPLSPSCPHGDLQIKNTLFVVLDQQQRAPFPGSELSHQHLVKLQNSFWFLGSFIYFTVSFEWVCKNYYTNIMFIYRLIRIFKVFYFFIEQQHFKLNWCLFSCPCENCFLSWLTSLNRKGCLQDRSSPLINLAVGLTDRLDYQLKLSATWDCYWCLAS